MADAKKESKRSIGKYTIFETLGKGGYSWVKKGEDTETGAVVALKFMNRATDQWALEQAEQVRTEIKSLTQVRHENVMKLYAYNLSAKYPLKDGGSIKTILLVLEYCPGGELFDILYYADKMPEDLARTYFIQACNGLQAVHKAGIAHRDLKPQNLLLDAKFQLKITDFGLSKIMETDADRVMKTTYVGTRGYQAPELLKNNKYTNACDIFSLGVVLFILLAGYPPFEAAHKTDKWYKSLAAGDTEKFWHVHRGAQIHSDAQELLNSMLCYKPQKRITLDKILAHKWLKGTTVLAKDLKRRVIGRYLQARENRKKDAKKSKDLIESAHGPAEAKRNVAWRDEDDYEQANEKRSPPKVPLGSKGKGIRDGMMSYYTRHKAYYALYAIGKVLTAKNGMHCKADPKDAFRLKCSQIQLVDNLEYTYSFDVRAYHDPNSIYTILHFTARQQPDTTSFLRVFRDVMQTLEKHDIFAEDGAPTFVVNLLKNEKSLDQKMDEKKEDLEEMETDLKQALLVVKDEGNKDPEAATELQEELQEVQEEIAAMAIDDSDRAITATVLCDYDGNPVEDDDKKAAEPAKKAAEPAKDDAKKAAEPAAKAPEKAPERAIV